MFTHLNTAQKPPKKGDAIVIETKRNKGKKVVLKVSEVVVNSDGHFEVIISKRKNKYFNWNMYHAGDSWVWRVWNLGEVQFTSTTNTMTSLDDL